MAKESHIFTKIRSNSQAQRLADALTGRGSTCEGRSISTVGALDSAGLGLRVTCAGCGESRDYRGVEMVEAFGAQTALVDLRDACAVCGSASVSRVPI